MARHMTLIYLLLVLVVVTRSTNAQVRDDWDFQWVLQQQIPSCSC